jgi:hypothetical protein
MNEDPGNIDDSPAEYEQPAIDDRGAVRQPVVGASNGGPRQPF